jgi:integrin alpha 7
MKYYEDLGSQIIHTYQVNNEGPWKAPYVEVDIDWPYQVGNDKPQGKWLLYLEGLPFVQSDGGARGECKLKGDALDNPLNLIYKPSNDSRIAAAFMEDPAIIDRSNKSQTFAREYREKISSSYSSSSEKKTHDGAILNRVRRDRAKIIKPEKLVDRDGKKSNIVSMVRI